MEYLTSWIAIWLAVIILILAFTKMAESCERQDKKEDKNVRR